ncbi:MAG: hypothetical protein ACTSR8_07450 [Promethearchaeota archaeon]
MIDELIILNTEGIPLFYYNFHITNQIEDKYYLMGSFLDQLVKFTKASLKEDLNILKWKDFSFFFYRDDIMPIKLIFKVDHSKLFGNVNIIKKPIDLIAKHVIYKFRIKYKDVFENFNGEISQFKSFSQEIDMIFKKK